MLITAMTKEQDQGAERRNKSGSSGLLTNDKEATGESQMLDYLSQRAQSEAAAVGQVML